MLAKALGARVIVTVGSEEKAEACRKLGADVAINYKTQDFVAETKKATGGKGAELIIDMVGGRLHPDATTRPPRWTAASCRSRSSARPRRRSISARS